MAILDISKGVFNGCQLVKGHLLDLFYIVLIAVELAQSYLLSGGDLKFASRRFDVHVLN